MRRYLWHFDAEGWPLERIDTYTGEHVPVFTGGPEESLHPRGRWAALGLLHSRGLGGGVGAWW